MFCFSLGSTAPGPPGYVPFVDINAHDKDWYPQIHYDTVRLCEYYTVACKVDCTSMYSMWVMWLRPIILCVCVLCSSMWIHLKVCQWLGVYVCVNIHVGLCVCVLFVCVERAGLFSALVVLVVPTHISHSENGCTSVVLFANGLDCDVEVEVSMLTHQLWCDLFILLVFCLRSVLWLNWLAVFLMCWFCHFFFHSN